MKQRISRCVLATMAVVVWMHHPAARAACPNSPRDAFEQYMSRFEAAKRVSDYSACEACLKQALAVRVTDYAAGSLVWAQMNQNKTEEALKSANMMLNAVGRTPYAVASFLDASLREGVLDKIEDAIDYAQRAHLGDGADWTNSYLRDMVEKARHIHTPAVYELRWTIPGKEFTTERPTRRFGFPLLHTPVQTFSYKLTGAVADRVVVANDDKTVVDITGEPGKPVLVEGTATITPQYIGARELRRLTTETTASSVPDEVGIFYYWLEPFDPATPSIRPVVQAVKRNNAVETLQAILTWRSKEMPYAKLPDGAGSTLDRIMKFHCGVCHHASYMSASLARACGIPAIVMGGDCLPDKAGEFTNADTSHGWISVKLPSRGWTEFESLDPNSLYAFRGDNYLRFARQGAKDEGGDRISLQGYKISGRRIQ